ncbi:hypothetical protein DL767_005184 [Monosporascus sp. MG133]|nr:hypothetical protein DL767_005184 [Monosporascus sp. MG133]
MTQTTAFEKINVSGSASFPTDWKGKSYQLRGVLDRRTVFGIAIPFRYGGDFTWYLLLYSDGKPTGASLVSTKDTRLELCWARAKFPNGPLVADSKQERTRVDMTPGYPILLWRLFAPPPTELPDTNAEDVAFYLHRAIVRVIWNPCSIKPRYDTAKGQANYALAWYGNGFKLMDWYRATYERCNCYDVAGISQLACSLMMDADGKELVDSHWVFQQPNGYINSGPLIGWVGFGGDNLRCNTPFWESKGTAPYVDPDDAKRTDFANHAWVEVTYIGKTGVLDACHSLRGIPPIPPVGLSTRQEYLNQTLDQSKAHGDANAKAGTTGSGSCWINPDTSLTRIGVHNPKGEDSGKKPAASPALEAEIDALVARGRTPDAAPPTFSAVDLAGPALSQVLGLMPVDDNYSTTSVSPDAARTTASFRYRADTRIVVTVDAFGNFERPVRVLVDFLSAFQVRPLDSVIRPGAAPNLGAYSFHTRTGALWIRGNLFVRIDQFSDQRPEPPFDRGLATRLDEHLAAGPAVPHLPSLELPGDAVPRTVRSGETIRVTLGIGLDRLAAVTSVSDDVAVVVPGGAPDADEDSRLLFYARKPGTTRVGVVAAARGSLRPIAQSFEVTVEGPEAPIATGVYDAPPPPSLGNWAPPGDTREWD